MSKADISVLMSIYYKEKPEYFQETMDSILNQTLQPDQILMIEDGPLTPELELLIEKYKNKLKNQFTVFSFEQNQGLGKALAEGVKLCRNPLIARMDTDDIMSPQRLELQYKEFEKYPELSIVGSNIIEFETEIENTLSKRIVPEENHTIREFSKRRNPFNHMTVMFRKEDILKVGNYQDLRGFEDYYLWVRLLKQGYKGKNIQKTLVFARTGKDMYARRGGLHYIMPGLKARKVIYKEGLGGRLDYIIVCGIHILISIVPNKIRSYFYEKVLHK